MHGRPHTFAVVVASVTGAAAIVVAVLMGLPLRDPDGMAGPSYVRLPMILGLIFLADLLPRAWRRADSPRNLLAATRSVVDERWPWRRVGLVLTGLTAFYVTYVGYRNLKSYLPFARDDLWDEALGVADSILFLGHDPAVVLHSVLGTGVAAYVLSFVYLSYLIFVPVSLAAALVWSRDIARGFWYVTALCLNWTMGAASYYLIPALGPVYYESETFSGLPDTSVSALQDALWGSRIRVLFDPWATGSVHGVAAFASLHVSVVFTAAYFAHKVELHHAIRTALWVYLGLTVTATVYFGWHYVVDDFAGVVIGWLAVTMAAFATGNDGRRARAPSDYDERVGVGSNGAAGRDRLPEQSRMGPDPGSDFYVGSDSGEHRR